MVPIRILIANLPDFVHAESASVLGGRAALFVRETFVAFLANHNVTFVHAGNSHASCSDDGLCSGELADLQMGLGDYLRPQSVMKLKNLGANLTTLSTGWEYRCYLTYKKQMNLNVNYSTFFDFIDSFDWYFWIILFVLFGFFTFITSLTIKLNAPQVKMINILWSQFEYIISHNCDTFSSITRKSIISVLSLSLLIIGILLSCSLQTGLVSSVDYVELETLEDVVKYRYVPITPAGSSCRYEIQNGISSIAKRVSAEINVIQSMAPEILYPTNIRYKHVCISDMITYILNKYHGCTTNLEDELRNPYDRSDGNIYSATTVYLVNRYNSPEVNSIIQRRTYSVFEKNIRNVNKIVKLLRQCFGISDAPQKCLNFKGNNRESVARISINYLSIPLISLLFSYFIGFCVLIVQKKFLYFDHFRYRLSSNK